MYLRKVFEKEGSRAGADLLEEVGGGLKEGQVPGKSKEKMSRRAWCILWRQAEHFQSSELITGNQNINA